MKKVLLIIFSVLSLDQISKIWVKLNMILGQEYKITNWFSINFIENNGMAYGLEFGGDWGKLFLTLFRVVAITAMLIWVYGFTKKQQPNNLIVPIAFIIAGAIGNLIDSILYGVIFSESTLQLANFLPENGGYSSLFFGKVVDMLYFPLWKGYLPEWIPVMGGDYFVFFQPVFNLADAFISIGFILLLIQKKSFEKLGLR